jgi:hypothetical protein
MSNTTSAFASIDSAALETVAGGASRSSSNDQLTQMLTGITSSIKDLASQKDSGQDPMQMMLMMMMMGGMGGGGGATVAAPVAAAPSAPPVINVTTAVRGGGKKGW